jgi:two-component sensor histidine kinase
MMEKLKILIVCENRLHCPDIDRMFINGNQTIARADSDSEALRKIEEEDFSMIVLDKSISDLKNFESAYLQVWKKLDRIPVILFTTFNDAAGETQKPDSSGHSTESPIFELLHSKFSDVAIGKSREHQIMGLLREKELLLREMNHRVKNNLQTIASMLNIQSFYVHDKNCLPIIQAIQSRIKSIAMVYESLYEVENMGEIDFGAYLRNVVTNLFKAFMVDEQRIRLKIEAEKVPLDRDFAMHCGLILNELVTNAIKYAFRDGESGEIAVSLGSLPDGRIEMSVRDTGIGFPENIDYKSGGSMGLLLVNALVEQVHGVLSMDRSKGTVFRLQFARPEHIKEAV